MLAVDAQNRSGKAVLGHVPAVLGPIIHGAVLMPGQAEIDALAQVAFELGEDSAHRLGVLPDVLAGAGTAIDSFPAVEAAAVKPMASRRRQSVDGMKVRSRNQ